MARTNYMDTATKATRNVDDLFAMIPDDKKQEAAELIAHIFNYGFRCNPRAAHGTIRLNATRKACENLPIVVRMEEVTDDSGRSFNALAVRPLPAKEA